MGTDGSFPRVKRPVNEVDRSCLSSAEGKNEWSCTAVPHVYLHDMDRDKFTLGIFQVDILFVAVYFESERFGAVLLI
jgi:hypothetical protein